MAGLLRQHLRSVGREAAGLLERLRRGVAVLAGIGGGSQAQPGVDLLRALAQHRLIERDRRIGLAGAQMHARQRHLQPRLARALLHQRRDRFPGRGQIAGLAQQVGLAHRVAQAQLVEIAALRRAELLQPRHRDQLAQHPRQLGILAGLQQQRGMAQQQRRAGLRLRGQRGADQLRRTRLVAEIEIGAGHRADQVRILAGGAFGLGQQRGRGRGLAGAVQRHRLGGLRLHRHAAMQLRHRRRALRTRDLLERGQRAGVILQLGLQQCTGLQRIEPLGAGGGQRHRVELRAGLVQPVLAHQQLAQRQTCPGRLRRQRHRLLQQRLCADAVAALLRLLGLQPQLVGAQRAGASQAGELAVVEFADHRLGLVDPAAGAQHADQPGERAHRARRGLQRGAVGALGLRQTALGREQVAQQDLGLGLLRIGFDRRPRQAQRTVGVAGLAGGVGLAQRLPVAGGALHRLPAAARRLRGGPAQQLDRLVEAFLAQPRQPQAAERVDLARTLAQQGLELAGGRVELAGIQCGIGGLHRQIARRGRGGHGAGAAGAGWRLLPRLQQRAQARVRADAADVLAQLGRIGRAARPQQRLQPGGACVLAHAVGHVGARRQRAEAADRFVAGGHAVAQVPGIGQLDLPLAGLGLGQPLQADARLVPALVGAAQRLVVLERQFVIGRLRPERLAVGAGGRVRLACLGLLACGGQQRLARGAGAHLAAQPLQRRMIGPDLAQPVDIGLGFLEAALVDVQHRHALQRVGMARIDRQQLAPELAGHVGAAVAFPVAGLLDQRLRRGGGGGAFGRRAGRGGAAAGAALRVRGAAEQQQAAQRDEMHGKGRAGAQAVQAEVGRGRHVGSRGAVG